MNDDAKTQKRLSELEKENRELKIKLKKANEYLDFCKYDRDRQLSKINYERFLRLNFYYIRDKGLWSFLKKLPRAFVKTFVLFFRIFRKPLTPEKHLKKILRKNRGKKIFLFYPGYDWYMEMYQRPQHMAMHFSEKCLFFYCTMNLNDEVHGFEEITPSLYVTDLYEFLCENLPPYTLYMCANMNDCTADEVKTTLERGNNLLYEYIDDLHEDLTSISKGLLRRHKYVLENDSIPVITTAQYLYDKAAKVRGSEKNLLQSTNGVVYEDFHITEELEVPKKIAKLVKEKKPIIGYYGALAKWFDYELVEKVALAHPEWNILLIGIDYDTSFASHNYFEHLKNVHYIGTVPYKELVRYGNCCDVLTIPFLINEITLSTSPVKVFEYMSMEKPIVTTALPECKKYESVLIGEDHDDFLAKLSLALQKKGDSDYTALLRKEALENTWAGKVNEILAFIGKDRKGTK